MTDNGELPADNEPQASESGQAVSDPDPQPQSSAAQHARDPVAELNKAWTLASKAGLRGKLQVDIEPMSAAAVERDVREQLKAAGDTDIDESLQQHGELQGYATMIRARVRDITNSDVGAVGCHTIYNIFGAAQASAPGGIDEKPAHPPLKDLQWPACAFAASASSIDQAAFLMSASVFDGFPVSVARSAADKLAHRLLSEVKVAPDAPIAAPTIELLDANFERFRLKIETGQHKQTGLTADCLRFATPGDAASILIYGWTRIAGFPNWSEHLNAWLEEFGASEDRPTRLAAGTAAGLLWAKGDSGIEARVHHSWYAADSTTPLDALDASYSAAAIANPELKLQIAKKLWSWGNISNGVDDIFALRHVSTRLYAQIDPEACFLGLGALLERNNVLGLLQAQAAFERLFVVSIESADTLGRISNTLIDVLARARGVRERNRRMAVVLQVSLVVLSLLLAKRKDKSRDYGESFYVVDRVLKANGGSRDDFARLVNLSMTGSPVQTDLIRALRAMFIRHIRECEPGHMVEKAPLDFFVILHRVGSEEERERLDYYLENWISAAADISEDAGRAASAIEATIRG